MNDEEFYGSASKSNALSDLNIVPILDMFISIIFFLLLSTSMIGLTKHVLPPSATKAITSETSTAPPMNTKIFIIGTQGKFNAILKWEGAVPGTEKIILDTQNLDKPKKVVDDIKKTIVEFKKKYPQEKTIQIAMKSEVSYQMLISVMDGVRESLPDVVLTSYESAESLQE